MAPFYAQSLIMMALLLGTTLASTASSSSASSSSTANSNYNVYHYDRARHFTPDGRLLQVEYAMAAAEQSSPLLVCQLDPDTLVIMSCSLVSSPSSSSSSTSTSSQQQQQTAAAATAASSPKPQDRIVVLENNVVVAMSGLLADSVALLKAATQEWQDWKSVYCGNTNINDNDNDSANSATMLRVLANAVGKACHENCFQGGIRPFGATMLLVGMNDNNDGDNAFPFSMLQTDPSGAVAQASVPSSSTTQQSSHDNNNKQPEPEAVPSFVKVVNIMGGNSQARSRIEKAIGKQGDKYHQQRSSKGDENVDKLENTSTIWERLQALSTILIEEQQQEQDQQTKQQPGTSSTAGTRISELIFGRKKNKKTNDIDTDADDDIGATDQEDPSTSSTNNMAAIQKQPWMEVVVVSRKMGIHKLTGPQIQQLLLVP